MTVKLSLMLIAFILYVIACKKGDNINPSAHKTGYLLSRVIIDSDTLLYAEYNNKHQLIKFTYGLTICDSIQYNSAGNLTSCRQIVNNGTVTIFHTRFAYSNNTIENISKSPYYGAAKKYTLMNNKIIMREFGFVYQGTPSYVDTISYVYSNENLEKSIFEFATSKYQPIDTFLYDDQHYNPYQTLGNHVYTLLTDSFSITGSQSILLAESKNIPSLESYATFAVSDTTLLFSGFVTNKTKVLQELTENNLLPQVATTTDNNGIQKEIRFTYIKM